ncbi:hypothetical protein [Mesorhizobium sp. M8A.F.Ca.ET.057.01.1.1]|uniref:hypothetical protein n=1 Tax=Mesorhizobium sp. M8A.F.Ca.ET.057.01.1.1 TaxID=2493679 RepID=UPI001FDF70E7|nr:hypothetical protein [Mesorhizobium sp. M8A.F.Ca.ET.057.01.1.1]
MKLAIGHGLHQFRHGDKQPHQFRMARYPAGQITEAFCNVADPGAEMSSIVHTLVVAVDDHPRFPVAAMSNEELGGFDPPPSSFFHAPRNIPESCRFGAWNLH